MRKNRAFNTRLSDTDYRRLLQITVLAEDGSMSAAIRRLIRDEAKRLNLDVPHRIVWNYQDSASPSTKKEMLTNDNRNVRPLG